MAKRLKDGLMQDGLADLVAGPDAYRELPAWLQQLLPTDDDDDSDDNNSMEDVDVAIAAGLPIPLHHRWE